MNRIDDVVEYGIDGLEKLVEGLGPVGKVLGEVIEFAVCATVTALIVVCLSPFMLLNFICKRFK